MTTNAEKADLLNSMIIVNPPVGSVFNEPDVPPLTLNIPDSGYPPEPYLFEPISDVPPNIVGHPTYDQTNYVSTGSKVNSEPSMHNEEGFHRTQAQPISTQGLNLDLHDEIYDFPMVAETLFSDEIEKNREEYLHPEGEEPAMNVRVVKDETKSTQVNPDIHIHLDILEDEKEFNFNESVADWSDVVGSPRFEAFTNSSSFVGNVKYDRVTSQMTMILNGKTYDFCDVPERKFESLKGAGSMGKEFNSIIKGQHDCSGSGISLNLPSNKKRKIQESIGMVRDEFEWLSNEYLDRVQKIKTDGQWYLIRASAKVITDHRGEGEEYRRKLDGDELHAMARTAINHTMDINHLGEDYKTNALIADSEYDKKRGEIQMLVHESDPDVISAIDNHTITAVSINGGAPRSQKIECEDTECFNVPRGVVLGELDDIALTWVVTNRNGMEWNGKHISPAKPGVSSTKIEILN